MYLTAPSTSATTSTRAHKLAIGFSPIPAAAAASFGCRRQENSAGARKQGGNLTNLLRERRLQTPGRIYTAVVNRPTETPRIHVRIFGQTILHYHHPVSTKPTEPSAWDKVAECFGDVGLNMPNRV